MQSSVLGNKSIHWNFHQVQAGHEIYLFKFLVNIRPPLHIKGQQAISCHRK